MRRGTRQELCQHRDAIRRFLTVLGPAELKCTECGQPFGRLVNDLENEAEK